MTHFRSLSSLVTLFAVAAWCFSGAPALASGLDILDYQFPTSWDGTGGAGSPVTDLSPAGNDGVTSGGAALTANIPPGFPAGTMSLNGAGEGGVLTNNTNLLENPTLEASRGYVFSAWIFWDGTAGNRDVQKIIDNEGTESLHLNNIDPNGDTADLEMTINDTSVLTLPILANQWYDVSATFDTQGNLIDGNGDLAGMATLTANAASVSAAATRTTGDPGSSDQFDRPIAVGVLALPAVPTLVNFSGDIYNPLVTLVPEPSSAILLMVAAGAMALCRRRLPT
jgi:hypothetical protein